MSNAGIDENSRQTLTALSSLDGKTIVPLWCNPTTHRLLVDNANTSSNLVIGTTTITSGGNTNILYDNNGVLGELTNNFLTPTTGVTTNQTVGQTIGATGARLTKLWTTDITVTNAITGSITGNAGTVTNGAYVNAAQSFTNANTFAKVIQTVTSMGAQALDGTLGNIFTRTLAGSEVFTQSGFSAGQCFMVEVTQGSGTSYTVTWFGTINWLTAGGTAPVQTTTSNGITTYGFRCTGTNTFIGYLIGSN